MQLGIGWLGEFFGKFTLPGSRFDGFFDIMMILCSIQMILNTWLCSSGCTRLEGCPESAKLANHTKLNKLSYKKEQPIVMSLNSCRFFCVHDIENLSALHLYGQLRTD